MAAVARAAWVTTLVLLLAGAHPAPAQEPTPAGSPGRREALEARLGQADENRDGKVDAQEARRAGLFVRESFAETDRDRDGFITVFELGQAIQGRLTERLAQRDQADADADGYVTREEAQKSAPGLLTIFERTDSDDDDRLSREELMTEVTAGYYSETRTQPVVPNIIDQRF